MRSKLVHEEKMKHFFSLADQNGDRRLGRNEFREMMHISGVQVWLSSMGLEASDADKLFDMLRGTDNYVDMDELVTGISALKGTARSLDVHYLMNAMHMDQ